MYVDNAEQEVQTYRNVLSFDSALLEFLLGVKHGHEMIGFTTLHGFLEGL